MWMFACVSCVCAFSFSFHATISFFWRLFTLSFFCCLTFFAFVYVLLYFYYFQNEGTYVHSPTLIHNLLLRRNRPIKFHKNTMNFRTLKFPLQNFRDWFSYSGFTYPNEKTQVCFVLFFLPFLFVQYCTQSLLPRTPGADVVDIHLVRNGRYVVLCEAILQNDQLVHGYGGIIISGIFRTGDI
jgi:hypothetical protein